ncbi:hypothetical protein [Micromonospora cremea]|uniref:Uncharacterized protein n=1 Tax=Micromonospora cremea TaxID=709881 RepID=A0A1N5TE23_9ACTN|nr:hypothetical protein [Micromonospora cremea]SIM46358.1 hypothetical protein SAMN04489832_0104 [Micromonospora cremea]
MNVFASQAGSPWALAIHGGAGGRVEELSVQGDGEYEEGDLALVWDRGGQPQGRLASPVRLIEGWWQVISWSVDPAAGTVSLAHRPAHPAPRGIGHWSGSASAEGLPSTALTQLLIGAARVPSIPAASTVPGRPSQGTSFNGKIDAPVLVAAAIPAPELALATPEQDVRADLVVTEQAAGGFVFATGSISWVQSMAVDEFDNDVARITENALRAALSRAKA